MAHEWNAGVLTESSWHRLEMVAPMPDAAAMLAAGRSSLAWPTKVELESIVTESGLAVPGNASVATYGDGSRVAHAAVGSTWTPLDYEQGWSETLRLIVEAGAKPAGAFSLRDGRKVLATFELPSRTEETRTFLTLIDSLDGTGAYIAGGGTVRVVCANTMALFKQLHGKNAARISHTASINDRAAILNEAIVAHVKSGTEVEEAYAAALDVRLNQSDVEEVLQRLFPLGDESDTERSRGAKKRKYDAAVNAMARPENWAGPNLASVWNAATYVVDRKPDGTAKHSNDRLGAMLFGTRGKRVEHIRAEMMKVVRADGTVEEHEVTSEVARDALATTGRSIVGDMLDDAPVPPPAPSSTPMLDAML